MKVSLLNERLLIEQRETSVDDIGNHQTRWLPFYSCATTISYESPLELSAAGTVRDHRKVDFMIRYAKEVSELSTTNYRVRFGDTMYNILGIDHYSYRNRQLKLHCEKVERT